MHLDTLTLSVVITVTATCMAALMASEWFRDRSKLPFALWAAGNGALALGWLLLLLRGLIPDFLSIVIANSLIGLCHAFLLNGVQRFLGLRLNVVVSGGIVLAIFLGQIFWIAVQAPVSTRVVYVPALLSLHAFFTAWYLIRFKDKTIRYECNATAAVFIGLGAVYVGVALYFWLLRADLATLFAASPAVTVLFFAILMGLIGWTIGFVSMVSARRQAEQVDLNLRLGQWGADLKQTEGELRRSNADLEQFAAVASHDLREPLRMVNSYLMLTERHLKDQLDDDTRQFMAFAREGARRMDQLILDLLDYSRIGRAGRDIESVSLAEAAGQAINNLNVAIHNVDGHIEMGSLPEVMGDPGELVRLFQNLIGNSLKYHSPDRSPQVRIEAAPQDKAWEVCISDNGIGIAPEFFDQIFGLFQRLHARDQYEGTGIGLACCKKIVEHHGGRIWVDSIPDQGSRFHFTLPVAPS